MCLDPQGSAKGQKILGEELLLVFEKLEDINQYLLIL